MVSYFFRLLNFDELTVVYNIVDENSESCQPKLQICIPDVIKNSREFVSSFISSAWIRIIALEVL